MASKKIGVERNFVPRPLRRASCVGQTEVSFVFSGILALLTILAIGAAALTVAAAPHLRDDTQAIVQWEHDAVEADLAGDADYYARNLSEHWTDGMSDGTFQTKNMLLDDLRDPKRNITTEESLADIRVNVSGIVAVATYRETYDAVVHAKRVKKVIITTDTFLKQSGRWIQIAAHSSAVRGAKPERAGPRF